MSRGNNQTRLALVEAIFHEALEVAPAERPALMAARSNNDAAIIAEVIALLAASDETDRLMERPAAESVRAVEGARRESAATPQSIGPFRIVRLLGEGGMGSVYEAEQDSPRRRVALKVVYSSMWSGAVRKRFDHEIEILAQLQHPGIARFYQAGSINIGGASNAYFAMELIDGEPLTRYVKSRSLLLPVQLELLARVCDAVHYAHQRGIIHRDLKPANILVEPPRDGADSVGQPKVLDFGIARDTTAEPATIVTRAGEFVGTLGYMSPEQCSALTLDTRSDVYSLGVVCFEALAGKLPIDVATRSVTDAITMMRDGSPTRLGSLRSELRGDIETVIHKALAREPQRRYDSASELAADLRRIVRNEPILARPASGLYHLRKFAGRNRVLVGAAAAVLVALSAGLAASMTMYYKAETSRKGEAEQARLAQEQLGVAIAERKRADREAELTAAVQQYLIGDLLVAAAPTRMGADVKLVDVLAYASDNLGKRFADRPEVQGEIRTRLAEVYSELGRYDQSCVQARSAMAIFSEHGLGESERWVSAALTLCASLRRSDKLAESLEIGQRAKDAAERLLPATSVARYNAVQAYAESLQKSGEVKEAQELILANMPAVEALGEADNSPLASMMSTLAACYAAQDRVEDLVVITRRAYELEVSRGGLDGTNTLGVLNNLINMLLKTKKVDEAAVLATDLPARAERAFPAGHPGRMYLCVTAASALRQGHHAKEAIAAGLKAYEAACAAFDPYRWETERCVEEIRMALADEHEKSERVETWALTAMHIRLIAAGGNEKESLASCATKVAKELTAASAEKSVAIEDVVNRMWKEAGTRAPIGDARRARYCGNLARVAAETGLVEVAREAAAAAQEALKDSPRKDEDQAIINAARAEAESR